MKQFDAVCLKETKCVSIVDNEIIGFGNRKLYMPYYKW